MSELAGRVCCALYSATMLRQVLSFLVGVVLVVVVLPPFPACAVAPTDVEIGMADTWVRENFLSTRTPPFSFTLDGNPSRNFLGSWSRQIATIGDDPSPTGRIVRSITWTNADARLEVRCVLVWYVDFPVAEWTVYLKNIGSQNTGNLRDILALDMSLSRTSRFEYTLYGIYGDFTSAESYRPFELTLGPGATKQFAPPSISGKSSDGPDGWPYHNLRFPGGGLMMAIGWPGQWASSFTRVGSKRLDVKAGQ